MLGGRMEGSFEVQNSPHPTLRRDVPTQAAVGKAPLIQGGVVSLDPSEIAVPVETRTHLPRAS